MIVLAMTLGLITTQTYTACWDVSNRELLRDCLRAQDTAIEERQEAQERSDQ